MPGTVRELTVFVASPGDLTDERAAVEAAVAAGNADMGPGSKTRLRMTGWERVEPDMGRPQALINHLVDECDIFVGLLNRRWGSGTGQYSSGFEEEFELAFRRHRDTGSPRILMFFRDVPEAFMTDPGPELQSVLRFRNKLKAERILLYRTFDSAKDLELQLVKVFYRRLAEEAEPNGRDDGETPPTTERRDLIAYPDEVPEPQGQISRNLQAFASMTNGSRDVGPLDPERLLLSALSFQHPIQTLLPQTGIALYQRRSDLALSPREYLVWVTSFLQDLNAYGVTDHGRRFPGWYFAIGDDPSALADLVAVLMDDSKQTPTGGALRLLNVIKMRPAALWPADVEDADAIEAAVTRWDAALREAPRPALEYLGSHAARTDDALLLRIEDLHEELKGEIEALRSLLADDPEPIANLVAASSSDPFVWQLRALKQSISQLSASSLLALMSIRRGPSELRIAAFTELTRRNHARHAVVEAGLRTGNRRLIDAVFAEIEKANSPSSTYALSQAFDALDTEKQSPIEARVRAYTAASPELLESWEQSPFDVEAFEALSLTGGTDFATLARVVFDSDAAAVRARIDEVQSSKDLSEVAEYLAGRLRVASLRILAGLPESAQAAGDVERARAEVRRKYRYTFAEAAVSLAKLGDPTDCDIVLEAAESAYGYERRTLIDSAVKLGGVEIARRLLVSGNPDQIRSALRALSDSEQISETELLALLYVPDASIRIQALHALRALWNDDREALESLTSTYTARGGTYYFNVLAELDRILFAPPEVRSLPPTGAFDEDD